MLSQTIYQTAKASVQLFSVLSICSVIIITLPNKGALNTPTFYHGNETKAQQHVSRLKQWNVLEKDI
jgi:hypothetical protein